jgi:hypothetical protein
MKPWPFDAEEDNCCGPGVRLVVWSPFREVTITLASGLLSHGEIDFAVRELEVALTALRDKAKRILRKRQSRREPFL